MQVLTNIIIVVISIAAIVFIIKQFMSGFATTNSTYGSYFNYGASNRSPSKSKPSVNTTTSSNIIGLVNLTNTCYISACLQILFQLIPETLSSGSISKLFFCLKKTHDRKDYELFKEKVEEEVKIVQGWEQQDAQ